MSGFHWSFNSGISNSTTVNSIRPPQHDVLNVMFSLYIAAVYARSCYVKRWWPVLQSLFVSLGQYFPVIDFLNNRDQLGLIAAICDLLGILVCTKVFHLKEINSIWTTTAYPCRYQLFVVKETIFIPSYLLWHMWCENEVFMSTANYHFFWSQLCYM